MNKRVTIQEIAQKSGVSLSTVSLVLNNKPGIATETRKIVIQKAEELGYPIKQAVVNPQGRQLSTLGMIVKTDSDSAPSENPFYSRVMLGIEEGCRRNGISLLFSTLPVDDQNHPLETPALFYNDQVNGLLLVGAFVDETVLSLSGQRTPPIVLVDAYSNTDRFDTVIADNFHAAYQEVEYLIRMGHQHIGMIGGEPNAYPSLRDRRNGYLRALKDHEITENYRANFNINKSKGYNEVTWMLKEHPQISALFCINDEVALTAMRAAQDMGRKIPEDLSVAGFDDIFLARNASPSLTSMHVDTTTMGRAAVQLLSFRLENPKMSRITMTINPALIERESTAVYKTIF